MNQPFYLFHISVISGRQGKRLIILWAHFKKSVITYLLFQHLSLVYMQYPMYFTCFKQRLCVYVLFLKIHLLLDSQSTNACCMHRISNFLSFWWTMFFFFFFFFLYSFLHILLFSDGHTCRTVGLPVAVSCWFSVCILSLKLSHGSFFVVSFACLVTIQMISKVCMWSKQKWDRIFSLTTNGFTLSHSLQWLQAYTSNLFPLMIGSEIFKV